MMIPTGTPIDRLTGGLAPKTVTLIYGPTGCGKTTLCVKLVNNLIQRGYKAIYIDTEGNVIKEMFAKPEAVQLLYAESLGEQTNIIKKLPEMTAGSLKSVIIADTMTGHFHRQVLAAKDKYRAAKAVALGSRLIAQLAAIRKSLRGDSIAVVTAHLRSMVGESFKETEARKVADLIRKGIHEPTIRDFEKFVAYDPVRWLGGQGLGMHTQMRFRIWIESEDVRILQLEKWPGAPPYCVRYDSEFNVIGDKFKMDQLTKMKLLKEEAAFAVQKLAEEGIPIEEEEEEEEEVEAEEEEKGRPKKKKAKRAEVTPEEPPSLDELIEKEKKSED